LALIISGVLAVGVLAAAVWLLLQLVEKEETGPEAALSLVFVATAVVLILVVCTLTIVFKRLWLANRNEAMGLPPGSVRSIIALLLIMLFFISAIFLFNSTKNEPVESRTLSDLSLEQFQQIPADQILSSTTHVRRGEAVYDVTLLPDSGNTTTSDDIAKQLITTVATLVTAVAAFYFGANSVASAHKAAGRERRERRRLRRWRGPGGPRGPRGPGPRRRGPRGGGPRQDGAEKAVAKRTAAKRTAATKAAVTKAAVTKAAATKTAATKSAATKKATSRQATPARKAAPRVAVRTPAKKGAAGTTR
jgi:hypothetical protein